MSSSEDEYEVILEMNEQTSSKTRKRTKKAPRDLIWKNITTDKENIFPDFPFVEEMATSDEVTLREPIDYFNDFVSQDFKNIIVQQSNLYSTQNDVSKPLNMNELELEQWLGMCMYFSISKVTNSNLHWKPSLANEEVSSIMSRDRWLKIKTNFHLSDNNNIDETDSLYKVRPLLNELRSKFRKVTMRESLCIDEQMIPFKGISRLKQYIPKKPHKWGYKFFVLSDDEGFIYDIFPYVGKIDPVQNSDVPDLGPSSNAVLHLVQHIPFHKNHKLFFDNWFTSVPLVSYLASKGIWCCGTVQARRIPSLKFKTDAELSHEGRGSKDAWKTDIEGNTVVAVKWQDTRPVCLISSFLSDKPEDSCIRYDKKAKSFIEVCRPNIVKVYNKKMGGVDLHDQMISLYRMSFRSKKYYQRMIFHLLDMTVVNSWIMCRRDAANLCIPKSKQIGLCEFKLKIAFSLMKGGKDVISKRGRPSISVELQYSKKRKTGNATNPIPQKDIRLDKVGHFPAYAEKRMTCKLPLCKGKIFVYCMKCKVHLCCDKTKNCFYIFHNE